MRSNLVDTSKIPGWGVDADPRNDPTYPMRDRSREDGPGMTWSRPPQQQPSVEILRSIEHNRLPAVLGTSTPPSGVSGAIRRAAFRYSESQWAHWLLLLLADRINVVEGVVQDLSRGRVPNPFAEMGRGAELKHDPQGFAVKSLVTIVITAAAAAAAYQLLRPQKRARGLAGVTERLRRR
jgi:hypothetical protein